MFYIMKLLFYFLILFFTFDLMTVKEYLKTEDAVSHSFLANKMWPTNKNAKSYLSSKLNGPLKWTDKDEDKARGILNELGVKLSSL